MAGRARREDGGQSLVEFALVLPLLLVVVLGVIDLALVVWQGNTLGYAAREGTRYAIVRGSGSLSPIGPCASCDLPAVTTVVQKAAVGVYNITVTTNYPDGVNDRTGRVAVTASAPFVPLASRVFLGNTFAITLRGSSTLVIQ